MPLLLAACFCAWQMAVGIVGAADAPRPRKIVLIAGDPDGHPPATHEYAQSVRLLRRSLMTSAIADQIAVETHFGGWPADERTLDDADTIVLVTSGSDRVETNHPLLVGNRLPVLEKQMQRGCGLVALHYSTFAPNRIGARMLEWLGGYFDYQGGPDGKWFSKIQHWQADLRPGTADHPICRGVKPFQIREELYYNLRFQDDDARRSPILLTRPPGEQADQAVAWAVERKEGGRGFGFTGGHYFDNWKNDDFRRLLLNAIAWTAHVEVPTAGVDSQLGDAPEKIRALIVTGHQYPGHPWRETTGALGESLANDPRLLIATANDVEALARRSLHTIDVVLFNYCNWERPGLSEAAKTNFVRFLRSGGGLVIVHFANGAFHFSLPKAAESDWPEWRTKICRRVWDHSLAPASGKMKSAHDPYGPLRVDIAAANHPVTQGLSSFATTDELYFNQQGTEPIEVLATAHSKVTDRDEPIAFVYRYGAARVFQTLLGHDGASLRAPGTAQLIRRGTLWAAGADPGKAEPIEPSDPGNLTGKQLEVPGEAFGKAFDVRGATAMVKAAAVYQQQPKTVELWARLDASDAFNVLVAQSVKESGEHWELFTQAGDGHLAAFVPGYEPNHVHSACHICDGRWHYLAMTFADDELRLAVDGKSVAEKKLERRAAAAEPGPLWIGGYPPGQLGCRGWIDELRISKVVRPVDRVPSGPFGDDEQTVGLWHFDALKDGTFADESVLQSVARAATPKAPEKGHFFGWQESSAVDDRWKQMDTGPFFSGTIRSPGQTTTKAIAIRVGADRQATWLFDTELMRFSCAWSGKFLEFNPRRFGLITIPNAAGTERFRTPVVPGWSHEDRFDDPRQPKPLGPLPRDWAHYRGLYRNEGRVTLAYTVGDVEILDSPGVETVDGQELFSRSLEIGASRLPLASLLAQAPAGARHRPVDAQDSSTQRIVAWQHDGQLLAIALCGGGAGDELKLDGDSRAVLRLAPQENVRRLKLIYWIGPEQAWEGFLAAVKATTATAASDRPSRDPGPALWTAAITTEGRTSSEAKPYVVDTLTLPLDNPYRALMFLSGIHFFADGDAAISTVHGDVWRVSGIDAGLKRLTWKRFATGLFQPLGVKVIDERVYVVGRDQITRLVDVNGDGEADFYENFNSDGEVTHNPHEFAACLETDREGNFYYLRGDSGGASRQDGCLLRVSRDGSRLDVVATGLRNGNGLAIGPQGLVTAAPQEGVWTPGSSICAIREGGFYGMMDVHHRSEKPTAFDRPLCWIPRPIDSSSGGGVWAGAAWGPLANHLLHLSYGRSTMMAVLTENVGGVWQGGVVPLPLAFESGLVRGRVRPQDGQVYVGGLNGWVTNAARDGCLQRVRYTGLPCDLPTELHFVEGGVLVGFSRPLERSTAEDPTNYDVEAWNYHWTSAYGSPDFKVSDPHAEGHDELEIDSATLQPDGRTVFLAIGSLKRVMQIAIRFAVRSADGTAIESALYGTINVLGPRPDGLQVAAATRAPGQFEPQDKESLRPGLKVAFTQAGDPADGGQAVHDVRVLRVPAWHVAEEEAPAVFLRPGPFKAEAEGYLHAELKGVYRFSLVGTGVASLIVNDKNLFTDRRLTAAVTEPVEVTLTKGFNRLRISYASPPAGDAALRLLWSSDGFEPELVPAAVLMHDGRDAELTAARQLRAGRELFAERRCTNCHTPPAPWTAAKAEAMPELGQDAPRLLDVGSRLRPEWMAAWLVDPTSVCDGATMPRLLHDRPGQSIGRQAADIAAYLATLGTPPAASDPAPSEERLAAGEALYEDLGCIQCHRFTPPAERDEFGRTSLALATEKFQPGALARYLRVPHADFAWSPMPDFHLSDTEVAALVETIRDKATARLPAGENAKGDAARGRELFAAVGCGQCHRAESAQLVGPPRHMDIWRAAATRGCLADDAWARGEAPDLGFNLEQRESLRAYLKRDAGNLLHEVPAEASQRLMTRLRCAACHGRDGVSSRAGQILEAEGTRGLAPEQLPSLTWTGEKLHATWTERLLASKLDYRARPWLAARMPAFPAWSAAIAWGLADEHGVLADDAPPDEPAAVETGRLLSLKGTGLDCRQCHGLEKLTVKLETGAQGISFLHVAERLRYDYYRRWMLDPLRVEPSTKMPRISPDRQHTAAGGILDGDAR
ncbi:MAG TPA: ThuA domain-containing protein, partial [Pirellulales bacterium]|nr:ThuA domain-containing protein [Pirellulales bacterium]